GSWYYGEKPTQKWVDNFHTGYNLSGLRQIDNALGTDEFQSCIQKGFEFTKRIFSVKMARPVIFTIKLIPLIFTAWRKAFFRRWNSATSIPAISRWHPPHSAGP